MEEAVGVGKFARYVIEPSPEGFYCFVFETTDSEFPERDYLQDTKQIVKEMCKEGSGVALDQWQPYYVACFRYEYVKI